MLISHPFACRRVINFILMKCEFPEVWISIVDDSSEMIVESRSCDSALARIWCVHEAYFNEQGKRATRV